MKRFLLWLVWVAIGVSALLAAVLGVSYSFAGEGSRPESAAQFGGQELEPNGSNWQVPLIGGFIDKVFSSPNTLSVQKLGTFYEAHPALTVPEWASYVVLTLADSSGSTVFEGSAAEYEGFFYPANGEYKAELTVWQLPAGMTAAQYEGGTTGTLHKNARVEQPARPTGYYHYAFRFELHASASLELSADKVEQGGIVGLLITGMTGDAAPTVETDLGSVQCVRTAGGGWRAYIPAAYNESAGAHEIIITVNGEAQTRSLTVIPREFGTAEITQETDITDSASGAASEEFRGAVWPLYEQAARPKLWQGGWLCPAESFMTLIDYGQDKLINGEKAGRSNSTVLYTIPGEPARAPANGVVVLAKNLALTGNTVVIDHGCGMRSYLYGLGQLSVTAGQSVERGQAVGALGEELTMDFKLGSKSVDPQPLFTTSGGLFWQENK